MAKQSDSAHPRHGLNLHRYGKSMDMFKMQSQCRQINGETCCGTCGLADKNASGMMIDNEAPIVRKMAAMGPASHLTLKRPGIIADHFPLRLAGA